MTHTRKVYSITDFLGDIGGILEISLIALGSVFCAVSEHSFIVEATKRLFKARTQDEDLFKDDDCPEEAAIKCKYNSPDKIPKDLPEERKERI